MKNYFGYMSRQTFETGYCFSTRKSYFSNEKCHFLTAKYVYDYIIHFKYLQAELPGIRN